MNPYIDRQTFEGLAEGWMTTDPAALDRLLDRAARQIDHALGPRPVLASGWKLAPALLTPAQVDALARAVTAQALHRFEQGEQETDSGLPQFISTPEFTVRQPPGRVSPAALEALAGQGLLTFSGTVSDLPPPAA